MFSHYFKSFVYRFPLRLDDSCFKSLSTIVTLFSDLFAEGMRNRLLQLVYLLFYFGLQYNSKSKTRQNGFLMALERTADNKKNNADYMRNNLSQFYFKSLHIKNWIQNVFCLFSCILQKNSNYLSCLMARRRFFFSDGLTLELQATILKTGWCVNIRSKEEFQNKLWSLSYGIQEQNPQTFEVYQTKQ